MRKFLHKLPWFTNVDEPLLKPPICVHQHPFLGFFQGALRDNFLYNVSLHIMNYYLIFKAKIIVISHTSSLGLQLWEHNGGVRGPILSLLWQLLWVWSCLHCCQKAWPASQVPFLFNSFSGDQLDKGWKWELTWIKLMIRECFVGVTMEEGGVSVIQEAGTSCGRGKVCCHHHHHHHYNHPHHRHHHHHHHHCHPRGRH